jgi:hypothetical protein
MVEVGKKKQDIKRMQEDRGSARVEGTKSFADLWCKWYFRGDPHAPTEASAAACHVPEESLA